MAKKKVESNMASVLAFSGRINVSNGMMYSTKWGEDMDTEKQPIPIDEKTVKGTMAFRPKKNLAAGDPMKVNAELTKANIHTVDSASLIPGDDTLLMEFSMKVLSGVQYPCACNNRTCYDNIVTAVEDYIDNYDFSELGIRYAMNIANGRFLWRNRVGANHICIDVSVDGEATHWSFTAHEYSLFDFDSVDEKVQEFGKRIADTLSGGYDYTLFHITVYVQLGDNQPVYPSQEMITNQHGDNVKSKVLFQINGNAAMHSEKLGNAIRTIDTWYPGYEEDYMGPININTFGTVVSQGKAYRPISEKKDFYTLFDKLVEDGDLPDEDDKHYVMAVLVLGGVFGSSSKEE